MVDLPGVGDMLQKLEGDFFKPIGKRLSLKFVNNGKYAGALHGMISYSAGPAMLVVTGTHRLFDAFKLNSGQEVRIEVRMNSRNKFEFGLCLPGTVTGENGEKELQANMFDAQKCSAGKLIRIDPPAETGMRVHLLTVDDRAHPLEMTRVKLYREHERISKYTWISAIIPGQRILSQMCSL